MREDDYQYNVYANALDKFSEEELYKLAQNHLARMELKRKSQLLGNRALLDVDLKNAIDTGSGFDDIKTQIMAHGQNSNDEYWSAARLKQLAYAQKNKQAAGNAISSIRQNTQTIRGWDVGNRSKDTNLEEIQQDVSDQVEFLYQRGKVNIANNVLKEFNKEVKLWNSINQFKTKYDLQTDELLDAPRKRQIADQYTYNQNPQNIQFRKMTPQGLVGGDDPALGKKRRYMEAYQNRDLDAMQEAQYAIAEADGDKPEKFNKNNEEWILAAKGTRFTEEGKKLYAEHKLREYSKGSGKWYYVNPTGGISNEQKQINIQLDDEDRSIRNVQKLRRDIYSKSEKDEGGLSQEYRSDLSNHPTGPAQVGLYKDPNERKINKNNLAQDLKMWFTGYTNNGDKASHSIKAGWITETFNEAYENNGGDIHKAIDAVRRHKNWVDIIGNGTPRTGYKGGEALRKAFNWAGKDRHEDAGDNYFLTTLNEYLLVDALLGEAKNSSSIIPTGTKTVRQEKFDALMKQIKEEEEEDE